MPKPSIAFRFSEPVLAELNERLRASAYGDLRGIADWVTNTGHKISKSSLHRYAVRLRKIDAERGSIAAKAALTPAVDWHKNLKETKGGTPARRLVARLQEVLKISSEMQDILAKSNDPTAPKLRSLALEVAELCTGKMPSL